jgi:hypothetical protein
MIGISEASPFDESVSSRTLCGWPTKLAPSTQTAGITHNFAEGRHRSVHNQEPDHLSFAELCELGERYHLASARN